MSNGLGQTLFSRRKGQSIIEFALILPLFILFIIGIFELGRAFFSYIAITNAAREGARVITFWPGKVTMSNVFTAVETEIGNSPMVRWDNVIQPITVECGSPLAAVTTDAGLQACPSETPVRVAVTYRFDLIFNFFSAPFLMTRSVEMMVP